jgi:hypothetical protein
MNKIAYSACVLLTLFIACGHKAAPLSKDRLSPKLLKVTALNNKNVQLTFSENLDTLNMDNNYFSITSSTETLSVITTYPSLSASEMIVVTEAQRETEYTLTGYVFDPAENKGSFEKTFTGSSFPDTIAPWVVDYSQGKNHSAFILRFSEAMDTSFFSYYIVPPKTLKTVWRTHRDCRVLPDTLRDILRNDTTYYLLIHNGARDLSDNRIESFITSITPDTAYTPVPLEISVRLADTSLHHGIAVLRKDIPVALGIVKNGSCSFEVRDSSTYKAIVIYEFYSGEADVRPGGKNIVTLSADKKDLDSIIH